MNISWVIDKSELGRVKLFCSKQSNNNFVQSRHDRNILGNHSSLSRDIVWKSLVACLLTTQQRSGPQSATTRFCKQSPFPLNYKACLKSTNIKRFVKNTLTKFGGIRFALKIANELEFNLRYLEENSWIELMKYLNSIVVNKEKQTERNAATFIINQLKGFGPKQSRNFIQDLGLSRYEIPIDSRIVKWLNDFGFPIKLSSAGLADENYYNFILDGIQILCNKCDIYPCMLDAAIFSSFDKLEWE